MTGDEELLIFQHSMAAFDAPAYLRRARRMEAEWTHLLAVCDRDRGRRLEMPRLRLAQLIVACDARSDKQRLPFHDRDRDVLLTLYEEWKPQLRSAVRCAESIEGRRTAARLMCESFRRFNSHWNRYLDKLDLSSVNHQRRGYNQYYILEKECAVRSARTAEYGFEPMPPATREDLAALFPQLPTPDVI